MKGLICITAFNRPKQAEKLVTSISKLENPNKYNIDLLISVDYSSMQSQFLTILDDIKWQWGNKKIRAIKENLGLKNHILSCFELVREYDYLVMLEDDLIVSPHIVSYINSCLSVNRDGIGMFSLYSYANNEKNKMPFEPLIDSFDNYFVQHPSSWGYILTKDQSSNFLDYLKDRMPLNNDLVPKHIDSWGSNSWKRLFAIYLVDMNLYTCFPRFSLSSNAGIDGTHDIGIRSLYSRPVVLTQREWNIGDLSKSLAIYDVDFNYLNLENIEMFKDLNDGHLSLGSINNENKYIFLREKFYITPAESIKILKNSIMFYAKKLLHRLLYK